MGYFHMNGMLLFNSLLDIYFVGAGVAQFRYYLYIMVNNLSRCVKQYVLFSITLLRQ